MIWWAAYCPSAPPQLMNSRTPPRAVLALATDFRSRRAHRRMIQKQSETGGTSLKAEWLTRTEPSIGLRVDKADANSSQQPGNQE
jgi:hypothetical protein